MQQAVYRRRGITRTNSVERRKLEGKPTLATPPITLYTPPSLTLTGHPHFYTNYENLMLFEFPLCAKFLVCRAGVRHLAG